MSVAFLAGSVGSASWAEKSAPETSVAVDVAGVVGVVGDTLGVDTLGVDTLGIDSIGADSIDLKKKKASAIDAVVNYTAKDSIVLKADGSGILYGESTLKYKDIDLKAEHIEMDMDSSQVFARGVQDSLGNLKGNPVFSDSKDSYEAHSLKYNFKTRKGFITHTVTEQGEGYVVSEEAKRRDDEMIFMRNGKYTTCAEHDHPHFYFQLTRAKMKPKKYVVSGPAYLVMEDVPLPLAIPFGYFPFTKSYSSGILVPTFGDERTRGFYLKEGGYYWALSDYIDLSTTMDIYTKGSWGAHIGSNYVKRYKFSGIIKADYLVNKTGDRLEKYLTGGEYTKNKDFNLTWTHKQDSKANRYRTFSASVNFATSTYERHNIDSYYNPASLSQNTKSSSVSLTQQIPNTPWSIAASMNVNQRTRDSTISLTLPDLNISMSRIYPLKRKKGVGKERWYEKIAISYTGRIENSITTKENLLLKTPLKAWNNGMKHTIPFTASYNLWKCITITPTFNYTERWYFHSTERHYEMGREVRDTARTFKRVYDYNLGVSAQTKVYVFLKPVIGKNVNMIRWVLTPSVGFSMHPDFGQKRFGYWKTYEHDVAQDDGMVHERVRYSPYAGGVFGVPSEGASGSVNFSLGNNVEMKVRSKKDTITGLKKISLIDNFSVSGSYNLVADSLNWSNFNANLRLKFSNKFGLSLSGSFDPYMYGLTASGGPRKINELRWNHGKMPQLVGTSTSFGYSFGNDTFRRKEKRKGHVETEGTIGTEDAEDAATDPYKYATAESLEVFDKESGKSSDYAAFKIPWNLRVDYSMQYGRVGFDSAKRDYKLGFTHNMSMSGNVSLTSKWKCSFSMSYDITNKEITYTNFNITRDLHCWNLTASFVPIGLYRSYNITVGINSSMLRDVKYNQRGNSMDSVW